MSKSFASGRQASSSSGCRQTRSVRVCTRIQRLRTPRAFKRGRQLEAALRVIPEEVVGDEDAVADRREVVDHGADRALAKRAPVELPDRAEAAAERAAARGLDQPDRLEEEAVVAVPVALDEVARRERHRVQSRAVRRAARCSFQPSRVLRSRAGTSLKRAARRERVGHGRHDLLAVVRADGVDLGTLERPRERGRGVPADEDEGVGREAPDLARRGADPVVLERVHAGDADQPRPRPPDPRPEPPAESQIDDRRLMAPRRRAPRRRTRGPAARRGRTGPARTARCRDPDGSGARARSRGGL